MLQYTCYTQYPPSGPPMPMPTAGGPTGMYPGMSSHMPPGMSHQLPPGMLKTPF